MAGRPRLSAIDDVDRLILGKLKAPQAIPQKRPSKRLSKAILYWTESPIAKFIGQLSKICT